MYESLKEANQKRWSSMKVNTSQDNQFTAIANQLLANKPRYQAVEKRTGVPWWFVAVVHQREASGSWTANIAQGDPWNKKSIHVPAGRGPFNSWEDAAVDALTNCGPYAAHNKDWTPGGALTMLELYNGLGYANRGRPSPYVWAGTNQYLKGKYVADHVYNPNAVDKQLGCAGLLYKLGAFKTPILPTNPGSASAGGAVITGGGAVAISQGYSWGWYIVGAVLVSSLVWAAYHWYKNRNIASNDAQQKVVTTDVVQNQVGDAGGVVRA